MGDDNEVDNVEPRNTARSYMHSNMDGSPRMLYNLPQAKICHFYRDGDITQPASKLVINQRYYRNLDLVQNELTNRMNLPSGVRAIYTPTGRHKVHSIDDLQTEGKYVCSDHIVRPKGVDIARVGQVPLWHGAGRPKSWQRKYNEQLRDLPEDEYFRPRRKKAWDNDRQRLPPIHRSQDSQKRLTIFPSINPDDKQVVMVNRKSVQSFEDFMVDLGNLFNLSVRRVFTLDGRPVWSEFELILQERK